ncbi:MAG: TM2 domain-containing protein [Nitrospiraceae bacterium]|nr:MAG: TM2 domain-containing protein [Nitrospiraceae bacterium]
MAQRTDSQDVVSNKSKQVSPKSRLVALLLCIFFGGLGIHRFYVNKIWTGILMILTLGGLGFWTLIDLIVIIIGSFKDKKGHAVFRWTEPGSV